MRTSFNSLARNGLCPASAKGSKSAEMYYASITRMTNKILGIESGRRDSLDATQLKQLSIIETIVDLAIRDGLKNEMDYKDIYRLAKSRCEGMAGFLIR